jgi:hypothetical protein
VVSRSSWNVADIVRTSEGRLPPAPCRYSTPGSTKRTVVLYPRTLNISVQLRSFNKSRIVEVESRVTCGEAVVACLRFYPPFAPVCVCVCVCVCVLGGGRGQTSRTSVKVADPRPDTPEEWVGRVAPVLLLPLSVPVVLTSFLTLHTTVPDFAGHKTVASLPTLRDALASSRIRSGWAFSFWPITTDSKLPRGVRYGVPASKFSIKPRDMSPCYEYFAFFTERLWGPPSLLYNGYQGLFPWG